MIIPGSSRGFVGYVPGSGPDPYWENVQLLLPMNGLEAGVSFPDVSNAARLITVTNTVQTTLTDALFGGSCGVFDGTPAHLSFPDSADFNWSTGDYTVEAWIRPDTVTGTRCILQLGSPSLTSDGAVWFLDGGKLSIAQNSGTVAEASASVTTGSWQHIAWSRASGIVKYFAGGLLRYTSSGGSNVAGSFSPTGASHYIGLDTTSGDSKIYDGKMCQLRITNYARYTDEFETPVAAFPTY